MDSIKVSLSAIFIIFFVVGCQEIDEPEQPNVETEQDHEADSTSYSTLLDYGEWKIYDLKRIYRQNEQSKITLEFNPTQVASQVKVFIGEISAETDQIVDSTIEELSISEGKIQLELETSVSPDSKLFQLGGICLDDDGNLIEEYNARFMYFVEGNEQLYHQMIEEYTNKPIHIVLDIEEEDK